MTFQIVEELAAPAGHLKEPAAGVEVLAVGPQVLGKVINPGGEQGNLHLARSSILIVGLVFGYDLGFYDCRHVCLVGVARLSETFAGPVPPALPRCKVGLAGDTVTTPAERRGSHGGSPQPMDFH